MSVVTQQGVINAKAARPREELSSIFELSHSCILESASVVSFALI
jgi:hypothetical protein